MYLTIVYMKSKLRNDILISFKVVVMKVLIREFAINSQNDALMALLLYQRNNLHQLFKNK